MENENKERNGEETPARCESCGAPLPASESVCAVCERALAELIQPERSRYPFSREKTKKFSKICPCCQVWLKPSQMPTKDWPEKVRWYVPQELLQACPNCSSILIDRHYRKQIFFLPLVVLMSFIGPFKSDWFPYWFWIYTIVLIAALSLTIITALRRRKDDASFVAYEKAGGCKKVVNRPAKWQVYGNITL